jgi:hypothetical protein
VFVVNEVDPEIVVAYQVLGTDTEDGFNCDDRPAVFPTVERRASLVRWAHESAEVGRDVGRAECDRPTVP